MVHAQEPTLTDLRIRSVQDTHKIFYAVQKGTLKMVTRRLDADERMALRSGCIYAWEERGPHSEITGLGIERFTEGRRWTPSRVRDEFLFYYERYMPPPDANQSGSPPDAKPPRDWEPLVKQTYSVWVDTESGRRKWHLTAYFTQGTIDQLRSVDDIPGLGDLAVPEGHFKSTRVGKRSKADDSKGESSKSNSVTRTYAPFPSPYANTSPAVESQSVVMYDPYAPQPSYCPPQSQPHLHDQPRSGSAGHSPDRSSASLSPPMQPNRTQYVAQQQQYTGSAPVRGDAKPSRVGLPDESRQVARPQQGEYNSLPPLTQSAMHPLNDAHSQRGLPTSMASPMQHMNHASGSQMPPAYGYSMQQHHQHQSYSMPHHGITTMQQQYPPTPEPITVTMFSPNPLPDMPRALPALHIAYEEPPYIIDSQNGNHYQDMATQPAPVPSPPPASRPPTGRALAPLHALNRAHPYKREYQDDKALRLLTPATNTTM